MGEIIQVHVGQAGVQIADACWELFCLEHGIQSNGILCELPCDDTFKNFFELKNDNKAVPRAVFVDSEPTVIDQVRTGPFRHLYSPQSLITGVEDSGSNFARGYYTTAADLMEITMDAVRIAAESSCSLQGFMTFRSIGGGTGSGLGNAIAEQIKDEYDKISKLEFVIFPSPSMSPLIVEPYNALLATHMGMDDVECTFVLDNESLYDICGTHLKLSAPTFSNLNRVIGQTVSTFTTSQRFEGSSSISFLEIETNLVPFPRIRFPVVSFAPFIPEIDSGFINITTEQITNACFDPSYQFVRCNPSEGKYMACVLLYRGSVLMSDIISSLSQLKSMDTVEFVDWSPTGFKVGKNEELPICIPGCDLGKCNKSLVTLSNNTIIREAWCRLLRNYEHLYSRRAFMHHFIQEGIDENSLKEAKEDINTLISDYNEVDNQGTCMRKDTCGKQNDIKPSTKCEPLSKKCENDEQKGKIDSQSSLPKLTGLESLTYFFKSDKKKKMRPNPSSETITSKVKAKVREKP